MDILSEPGSCDVTADVDFSLLAKAVNGVANAYGPVNQSHFLQAMGIATRLKMLLTSTADTKTRKKLIKGVERLVSTGENGMGKLYKIQAILPATHIGVPYAFANNEPSLEEATAKDEKFC